jgi:hypothetical protein
VFGDGEKIVSLAGTHWVHEEYYVFGLGSKLAHMKRKIHPHENKGLFGHGLIQS